MADIFVSDPQDRKTHGASLHEKVKKEKQQNFGEKDQRYGGSPLSSFWQNPSHVRFSIQDPQEKVILVLRRHPVTNTGWLLLSILMFFAPPLITGFPLVDFLPANFQFVLFLFWYLLIIAFSFEKFLTWYFNVHIVTDERVVDVDFINLIYREVTDANIDKIQDVTVQMGGVVRSLFNYGNVIIQTASELPLIEFQAVPKPDKVARILRELILEEEQEKLEGRIR